MTEQEAKELIKYINKEYFYYDKEGEFDEINEALDMAISALEGIQQYRALSDELKSVEEEWLHSVTDMVELRVYRNLGTVEELREAREKQVPKKPAPSMNEQNEMFVDYTDGHREYKVPASNWLKCPCCDAVVGKRVVIHKHVYAQQMKNYCPDCGQAIDWT